MSAQPIMRVFRLLVLQLILFSVFLTPAGGNAAESRREPGPDAASASRLPVSKIILYSSGVGCFQRDGEVNGKATIDLRFKVDDINDLLKSMVVQDLDGGHVSTVTYGSRDPLTKTLKSFALDLTSNPTLGQLLDQARGERVEVSRPGPLVGTILGVERKSETLDENRTVEREYLNLLTAEGLQSIPMTQVHRIRLLNEDLNAELRQALEVLAAGHDTQKKTVSLEFNGTGKRRVSVAYIAQTPVWKTSYRLVLDDKEPFLQGWAIVENTSDEDWDDVQLSLVSGRPISFAMDLYQPLYTTRPVVQPELYTSLRPQVYGDSLEEQGVELARRRMARADGAMAGGFGGGGALPPAAAAPSQLAAGGRPTLKGVTGLGLQDNAVTASYFFRQTPAAAEGTQAGELFQYSIKVPVSLARQKSAMLPIISEKIEGEKLSIYNPDVQSKYALNGFRLKNSTPLHLMQGPITVFDAGSYAGDARIEDIAPGQDRLISYALDLKAEVEPQIGPGQQELTAVSIRKGTLVATRKALEEKTYNIRNRDQKPKTVLIEHPFRSDWDLVEPKEASERTRDLYRFAVNIEPDARAKLQVREQKQLAETVQLIDCAPDVIAFYIRSRVVSPKVREALEKAVTLRDRVSRTALERERREKRSQEISEEQARIRENMTRLSQSSDLYSRYVKKLDEQETELENLRREIENLKIAEARQQQELNDYLLNLDVS